MARPLGFLLMGAARSGTSAVTTAINCHPLTFCGMESFCASDRHRDIVFPRSFDQQLSRMRGAKHDLLKRDLEIKRAAAVMIGNKQPHYDFFLPKILQELPHLRLIFIYRDPREFLSSWNRQASDSGDEAWHPGQRGLFGVLALFNYIRRLTQISSDCLIVPYRAFSRDVAGTTTEMLRYLNVDNAGSLAGEPQIERLQIAADRLRDRERGLLSNEAEFLNAVSIQGLDAMFDRPSPFRFSQIRADVLKAIYAARGHWGQNFVEALVGYEDPHVILYFRKMLGKPYIADMFAEEAAFSPRLSLYLRALPKHLKLRRLLLRQDAREAGRRFILEVQTAIAA